MENLKRIIVCLSVLGLLVVAIPGCRGKSDEKKLAELNEQMDNAKSLEEIAAISKKIKELNEKIRSNQKTTKIALGRPTTYRQIDDRSEKEITKFQITFRDPKISYSHPVYPISARISPGKGNKYFSMEAHINNLGPRAKGTYCQAEVKVNSGHIYKVVLRTKDYPNRDYIGTIEPGKSQMVVLFTEIPEDTYPVEVFGELGGEWFMGMPVDEYPSDKKFSLQLTLFKK